MEKVGFVDVELVGETGLDSSPVTRGTLFRAGKGITSRTKIIGDPVMADGDDTTAMPGEAARRFSDGPPT
jgi:hypothetical protein